jgi:hypothetical protein
MTGLIKNTFDYGEGIFNLQPSFVTRNFSLPGFRLKLHPDDYYAFGMKAGAVMERWLSSVTRTRNNNLKRPDEGLSYILGLDAKRFLLSDALQELKETLIGRELQETYGTWPIFSKFFDYRNPLFFHFHPNDQVSKKVGCSAKPECYYFPAQLNSYRGERATTYFGFNPEVDKEEIRQKLIHFEDFETHMTTLSKAYELEVGTGWYVPAGVLHAPGSLLTYEPQWSTDLNCVFENSVYNETYSSSFLNNICPPSVNNPVDYIMDAVDWEKNFDMEFKKHYFRPPIKLPQTEDGLMEKWICYGNDYLTSKEVSIAPKSSVVLTDNAAYGCVIIQGFGQFGVYDAEVVNMMRVNDITADEFFVSKQKAKDGVRIVNNSRTEPMTILQHFGPDNIIYVD